MEDVVSIVDLYPERVRQTQVALLDAAEAWREDVKAQLKLLQTTASGRIEPARALQNAVQLATGLVRANVRYTTGVVSASMAGVSAVGRHTSGAATAVKADVTNVADGIADSAQELRTAERAQARRAKKVARDAEAERYQHMTKVQLSEELAQRHLRKSGNVAELRARLMEADLEADA